MKNRITESYNSFIKLVQPISKFFCSLCVSVREDVANFSFRTLSTMPRAHSAGIISRFRRKYFAFLGDACCFLLPLNKFHPASREGRVFLCKRSACFSQTDRNFSFDSPKLLDIDRISSRFPADKICEDISNSARRSRMPHAGLSRICILAKEDAAKFLSRRISRCIRAEILPIYCVA
jgi:hypothetical protein